MIKNIHSLLIFNVRQQIRRQRIQNARQIAKDQKFRLWNLFQPDLGLNSIFTFYSDLIALPILKREEAKKKENKFRLVYATIFPQKLIFYLHVCCPSHFFLLSENVHIIGDVNSSKSKRQGKQPNNFSNIYVALESTCSKIHSVFPPVCVYLLFVRCLQPLRKTLFLGLCIPCAIKS